MLAGRCLMDAENTNVMIAANRIFLNANEDKRTQTL
jgi:hypothetical protein